MLKSEWEQFAAFALPRSETLPAGQAVVGYDWSNLAKALVQPTVAGPMSKAYEEGAKEARDLIGRAVRSPTDMARRYVRARTAEMVGMERFANGRVREDVASKWTITRTTEKRLAEMIDTVRKDPAKGDLQRKIEGAPGFDQLFGRERALTIQKTELDMARLRGKIDTWGYAGRKRVLGQDGLDCGLRAHVDGDKVHGTIRSLDVAAMFPLGHPNCRRDWVLPAARTRRA